MIIINLSTADAILIRSEVLNQKLRNSITRFNHLMFRLGDTQRDRNYGPRDSLPQTLDTLCGGGIRIGLIVTVQENFLLWIEKVFAKNSPTRVCFVQF